MNFAPAVMDVAAPVAAFFNFHAKNSDGQQTRAAAESPTAVIGDVIHFVNKVDAIGKCECHVCTSFCEWGEVLFCLYYIILVPLCKMEKRLNIVVPP